MAKYTITFHLTEEEKDALEYALGQGLDNAQFDNLIDEEANILKIWDSLKKQNSAK